MTPEHAIEVLELLAGDSYIGLDADGPKAINLGIEALRYYQELKRNGIIPDNWLLPSETEDLPVATGEEE